MQAEAIEVGERPVTFTSARRYAPAGAKELANLLAQQEFADIGMIVLDWSNELGAVPNEASKPIMHVKVMKKLPQYTTRNVLTVDARLDVDDVFGNDEVTASVLVDLVQELKEKVNEQLALRGGE